ncbi:MAG: hypothetical protein A2Y15_06350 [Clostridiales bacterium GWF2_36_10]|nr:MAG: hypothetical protein A2Y15_06350 [Clostridiales bacterium GWF2_36_10]HAN21861.1 hypothetical protein [Clostridiales bacterium]
MVEISEVSTEILPEILYISHNEIEIAVTCEFIFYTMVTPYNTSNTEIEWSSDNPLNLNNIQSIHATGNRIQDISALDGKKLNNLHLDYNLITDISPFLNIEILMDLNLSSNNIVNITPLKI